MNITFDIAVAFHATICRLVIVEQDAAMKHGDIVKVSLQLGASRGTPNVLGEIAAAGSAILQVATWSPLLQLATLYFDKLTILGPVGESLPTIGAHHVICAH